MGHIINEIIFYFGELFLAQYGSNTIVEGHKNGDNNKYRGQQQP